MEALHINCALLALERKVHLNDRSLLHAELRTVFTLDDSTDNP